jgi:glycosyltransferase involved in cell wall biosynthesis
LQVGYFYSSRGQHRIRTLLNEIQPDHIYCQLLRVAEYVKRSPIAKTLDYQDVFSKGAQRRSMTAPFFMRPLLRFEYKRLLKYEHEIFDLFDNKTIISVPDRDLIPHPERDQIAVVINGVDTDFFTPREVKPEYDIVFTGNMGYPPNVDAAVYLARDVLPRVLEKRPGTTLTLAGATPHSSVQALKSDHVKVTGWVEDIRDCYAKARLFIAPMRIGTGLQNKLLEAMAMRIPSITSPLANQALDATHGQEVLVGNSTDEYATLILQLLEDEKLARQIADNGHRFIHEKFDWAAATQVLEDLIVKS